MGPTHEAACSEALATVRRRSRPAPLRAGRTTSRTWRPLYSTATLVLCRAGATTVAETTAIGVPAVYVPWSGSAEGQQAANARPVAAAGGGVVVTDAECTVDGVEPILSELLADPERLHAMAEAAAGLGRRDAAARVAALVLEVARGAAEPEVDLSRPQRLHVIGAGGAGMSAYAAMLARARPPVTGSDVRETRGRSGSGSWGWSARRPAGGEPAADLDAVVISSAVPERPTSRCGPPSHRGDPRAAQGGGARRDRSRCARSRRRGHPRQDDDVVDDRP